MEVIQKKTTNKQNGNRFDKHLEEYLNEMKVYI